MAMPQGSSWYHQNMPRLLRTFREELQVQGRRGPGCASKSLSRLSFVARSARSFCGWDSKCITVLLCQSNSYLIHIYIIGYNIILKYFGSLSWIVSPDLERSPMISIYIAIFLSPYLSISIYLGLSDLVFSCLTYHTHTHSLSLLYNYIYT